MDEIDEKELAEEQAEDDFRRGKILSLVISAMSKQASATFNQDGLGDMDLVAQTTADEIMKLF